MNFESLTILPGTNKAGEPEHFAPVTLHPGELCAIAGNTGAGKSRLIKDIEQLVNGDGISRRGILINDVSVTLADRSSLSKELIAHLSQSMRFVLDLSVREFLKLHCQCRNHPEISPDDVLAMANQITPEPVLPEESLNLLSGGQTRALMIADLACICDSPIVLIDEIENAGIDKKAALRLLTDQSKLVLIVTHDPHTALMASTRLAMKGGEVCRIRKRTEAEKRFMQSWMLPTSVRNIFRNYFDKEKNFYDNHQTLLEQYLRPAPGRSCNFLNEIRENSERMNIDLDIHLLRSRIWPPYVRLSEGGRFRPSRSRGLHGPGSI